MFQQHSLSQILSSNDQMDSCFTFQRLFPLLYLFQIHARFPNVNEFETAEKCLNPKISISHEHLPHNGISKNQFSQEGRIPENSPRGKVRTHMYGTASESNLNIGGRRALSALHHHYSVSLQIKGTYAVSSVIQSTLRQQTLVSGKLYLRTLFSIPLFTFQSNFSFQYPFP